MTAYEVDSDQIIGGPGWVNDDRYDIEAQVDGMTERLPDEQMRPLPQRLLADRFGLKIHIETREMQLYLLAEDTKGQKLQPHKAGEPSTMSLFNPNSTTKLVMKGYSMPRIAKQLSSSDLRVVDGTGLKGEYDFTLEWADTVRSETGVSFSTAVREQLGLRLEPRRMPVEVMVIDAVRRPSEN